MQGIKLELNYLLDNQILSNCEISDKLKLAIKYYLSRASTTLRNSKIIQLNHYIDDVFTSENNNFSRNIVFSPSKVPLLIAVNLNSKMIEEVPSKLFKLSFNGNIEISPLEYIIPALIAIFSGDSSRSGEFINNGKLFMASLLLSAEITEILYTKDLSNSKAVACITVVLIASTLFAVSKESVVYIVDQLLSQGEHMCDMRNCLELVVLHSYPPHGHSLNHKSSKQVEKLITDFEQPFLNRKSLTLSPTITHLLLFSLPSFSPLSSIISSSLSLDTCKSSFQQIAFSIHPNLFKDSSLLSSSIPKSTDNIYDNVKWCLSSFIVWCRSNYEEDISWILFDFDREVTLDMFHKISLKTDQSNDFLIKVDISYSDVSLNRQIKHDQSSLKDSLNKFGFSLNNQILNNLSSTVGVDGTRILLERIDDILEKASFKEVLEYVFERPPLD